MQNLSSLPGFFFFFLLIIWFHFKVVGIENYAICNPVVFPVREIPDMFLPGLIINSQTLVAGGSSLEFLWLKPHTAVADRWLWKGLWYLPSVMAAITCQQPGWFETLTFSNFPQRLVLASLLRSLQTFDTTNARESLVSSLLSCLHGTDKF